MPWVSFLDGFSGNNQICMAPKDAENTAFRTPIGNFYCTMMPFGLKNTGATYQCTMTMIFHDMMHCEMEDCMDNVVVKSRRQENHIRTLRKVFERCRLYKLRMNPLKWVFGVSVGKFLEFLVHSWEIDIDLAKAFVIATMKLPPQLRNWRVSWAKSLTQCENQEENKMQKRRKKKKMKNHRNRTLLFFSILDFGFFVGYVALGFWDCASLDT